MSKDQHAEVSFENGITLRLAECDLVTLASYDSNKPQTMQIGGWLLPPVPERHLLPVGKQRLIRAELPGWGVPVGMEVNVEIKGYGNQRHGTGMFVKVQWPMNGANRAKWLQATKDIDHQIIDLDVFGDGAMADVDELLAETGDAVRRDDVKALYQQNVARGREIDRLREDLMRSQFAVVAIRQVLALIDQATHYWDLPHAKIERILRGASYQVDGETALTPVEPVSTVASSLAAHRHKKSLDQAVDDLYTAMSQVSDESIRVASILPQSASGVVPDMEAFGQYVLKAVWLSGRLHGMQQGNRPPQDGEPR